MRYRILSLICALSLCALSLSAATYTVTTTADAGAGSLRAAITSANADAVLDTIAFNIGGVGPYSIALASPLPDIIQPVLIDGWSQPGFAGTPLVEINGSAAGACDGLKLAGTSDGSTVRGLVINGFAQAGYSGIRTDNTDGHTFHGNWIGLDTDGTTAVPNSCGLFLFASLNNIVGGTGANQRNVIGGNANGGQLNTNGADGTVVVGNYLGTDVTGLLDRGLFSVVTIFFTDNMIIGGANANERNVIGGGNPSISISGTSAGNQILGNSIGVGADGTTPIPSSTANIEVSATGPTTIIGNIIANSINLPGTGVLVYTDTTQVNISQNSIFNNFGLGIDLNNDGVTANDAGDADVGENNLQNYPVITSATESAGTVTIVGTLNSTPSSNFTIEFYANAACDSSGFGEGETYLGNAAVSTDGSGNAAFNTPLAGPATGFITAIARDASNNTSEFSGCTAIVSGAVTGTAQLTSTTFGASEASSGGSFAVSRTGGTEAASVQYTLTDVTATNGADYVKPATGFVTWADGDTATKFVFIPFLADALPEGTETFTITLSNPSNIGLGATTSATFSILDDDAPTGSLAFSSATYNGTEGTSVLITVNRTGGSNGAASIDYGTAPGTATAGDFSPVSGTLVWSDGDTAPKTFSIPLTADIFAEPAELFTVTLSNATGAAPGNITTATVTIAASAAPVAIPTASTAMLLVLLAALSAAAIFVLRR